MNYFLKIALLVILKFFKYVSVTALVVITIYTLYALPASISLPSGIRPGLESKTIHEAVLDLRKTGRSDRDLVEASRLLVGERMAYCRRNSYNSYKKAFKRGYGFCQQQAFALSYILKELGFEAYPVQAIRTQFPDGNIGGHAWVMVMIKDEMIYIDPVYYNPAEQKITFTPLSEVTGFSTFFRLLAGWGGATINAHRYYTTGTDNP
jgi:hypothetical protein